MTVFCFTQKIGATRREHLLSPNITRPTYQDSIHESCLQSSDDRCITCRCLQLSLYTAYYDSLSLFPVYNSRKLPHYLIHQQNPSVNWVATFSHICLISLWCIKKAPLILTSLFRKFPNSPLPPTAKFLKRGNWTHCLQFASHFLFNPL